MSGDMDAHPASAMALPSDEELVQTIRTILESRDLTKTSLKEVRNELESHFKLAKGALDVQKDKVKELTQAEITRITQGNQEEEPAEGGEGEEAAEEEGEEEAAEAEPNKAAEKPASKKRGAEKAAAGDNKKAKRSDTKEKQALLMTRKEFMSKAKAFTVQCGTDSVKVEPKTFKTGGVGFYGNQKVTVMVGGKPLKMQANLIMSVIGSKEWQE